MARSERAAVVVAVEHDLAAVASTAVDAVRTEVPAYRELADDQVHDVRAIAAWTLRRVLHCWRDGTGLTPEDLRRFRTIGSARATDGRPVAAVLRAYRVAAVAGLATVRDLDRGRLDVDDVTDLTAVLLTVLDELSEALLTGHAAGRDRLDEDRDRALAQLLDDLLAGRQSSSGALADRTRELGLALPHHPVLLVAEPGAAAAGDLPRVLRRAGAVLAGPHAERVVAVGGTGLLAAAPGLLAGHGGRGCSISGRPLATLSTQHRLAAGALDAAPPHAFRVGVLLDEADAHVLALLGARPGADPARVVPAALGPLTQPAQAHVLQGLRALLTTGSASAAAAELDLHPQTLRYRVRRAEQLTGRDPADPWHHLVLSVAVQLHRELP